MTTPTQKMKTFHDLTPQERQEVFDPRNPRCPFHKYIGNQAAVRVAIRIAKAAFDAYIDIGLAAGRWKEPVWVCTREYQARILLTGPKSVGKTTFARCYAELVGTEYKSDSGKWSDQPQLRMPFVEVDGTRIRKPEQLLERMQQALRDAGIPMIPDKVVGPSRHYTLPPFNLFIDEVHRLPLAVQEGCLKMSEPSDGLFEVGNNIKVDCRRITIIIATTKPGKLERAFHSRFPIKLALEAHSLEDLATIIHQANPDWKRSGAMRLARLKPVPREALDVARLVNATRTSENCSVDKALGLVAADLGLQDGNLTQRAIDILKALADAQPDGLSKKNLCASCDNIDATEFEEEIIPNLLRNQFHPALVTVSSRHKITEAGLDELRKRDLVDY